jgi:hypothetical protein
MVEARPKSGPKVDRAVAGIGHALSEICLLKQRTAGARFRSNVQTRVVRPEAGGAAHLGQR